MKYLGFFKAFKNDCPCCTEEPSRRNPRWKAFKRNKKRSEKQDHKKSIDKYLEK